MSDHAAPPQVDVNAVVESLAQQVARLIVDLAVREAVITGLRAELAAREETP